MPGSIAAFAVAALISASPPPRQASPRLTPGGNDFEALWPKGAPGAMGESPADNPGLTFFFPDSAIANGTAGTAVIVCPGGAYGMLAREKEGVEPAQWLKSLGVKAFLLDYRVGPIYRHPVEMGDGLRAVRWVRANANRFGLDPRRIGMLGFSAGGHLTATVAAFSDDGDPASPDPVERASSRPDFQILIYPVISMQAPFAHRASRINLLGRAPTPAALDSLSADRHVDARTPPAFIVHAEGDPVVAFAHSQAYADALREAKVPVEFLGFVQGGHAFGLAADKTGVPGEDQLATWPSQCAKWMGSLGLLGRSQNAKCKVKRSDSPIKALNSGRLVIFWIGGTMVNTGIGPGNFRASAFLAIGLFCLCGTARSQTEILLWPGGAPGAKGSAAADKPSIKPYIAANPNGAAVVVFPGGGYTFLADDHEGLQPAKWLNTLGVSAFVVKYRLGSAGYRHPIEMGDGQRAIRWVRANAKKYGVDPRRVGVLGFSAGGHMAATVSTHWDSGDSAAADSVDRKGCRPDWSILAYPVITMDASFTHMGSRENLLGNAPSQKLVDSLSNEKQVTSTTPPAFLFHSNDDNVVKVKNAQAYYDSLGKHGIERVLKLYEKGGHGYGMADGVGGAPRDAELATWTGLAAAWMEKQGWFKPMPTAVDRPWAPIPAARAFDAERGFGFRFDIGDRGFIDAAGRRR